MSHRIVRLSASVLPVLAALETLGPAFGISLPIGGSHAAETAIVLGVGYFLAEIVDVFIGTRKPPNTP